MSKVSKVRFAVSLVAGSAALLCSSCSTGHEGVTLPSGAETLKPCQVDGPVNVPDLATSSQLASCDPEGVVVVFPDGEQMTAEAVGVTLAAEPDSDSQYSLINWGVPGLSAGTVRAGSLQLWGSPEAMLLYLESARKSGSVTG